MRQSVIHSSLHRTNHLMGAERELVMLSALSCLIIVFGSMTLFSLAFMTVFWFVAIFFLRKMAKKDPHMSKIYLRHIKYQNFYSAKSPIWRTLEGYRE